MNLLLIEDDELKRNHIIDFLKSNYPSLEICVAKSVQSGIEAIKSGDYDLFLLDMTLPTFDITPREDGGRPQSYGGRELLRHIDRLGISTLSIIITGFDKFGEGAESIHLHELDIILQKEHKNYIGSIHYSSFEDSWKQKLLDFITPYI